MAARRLGSPILSELLGNCMGAELRSAGVYRVEECE